MRLGTPAAEQLFRLVVFTMADLRAVSRVAGLKQGRAEEILAEVYEALAGWQSYAQAAGVQEEMAAAITVSHRLALPSG